jgi:hypothetical protein
MLGLDIVFALRTLMGLGQVMLTFEELQALLGHREQQVPKVLQVAQGQQVVLDHKVSKDQQAMRGLQDPKARQAHKGQLDHRAVQVIQGLRDLQGAKVLLVIQVPQALPQLINGAVILYGSILVLRGVLM